MNDENKLFLSDLAEAERLYGEVEGGREAFMGTLSCLLELVTFLPVCGSEYASGKEKFFSLYPKEFISEVNGIFTCYGFGTADGIFKI